MVETPEYNTIKTQLLTKLKTILEANGMQAGEQSLYEAAKLRLGQKNEATVADVEEAVLRAYKTYSDKKQSEISKAQGSETILGAAKKALTEHNASDEKAYLIESKWRQEDGEIKLDLPKLTDAIKNSGLKPGSFKGGRS